MGNSKREYWLDLFSVESWNEFLKAGADTSGFRKSKWDTVTKIKPGDYLLCYVIGISRFIGILEVISEPYYDDTKRIFSSDIFPSRMKVKVVSKLELDTSIPIKDERLKELSFFKAKNKKKHYWISFFRSSPRKWSNTDGEIVIDAINKAKVNPISIPVDDKRILTRGKIASTPSGITVTIPINDDTENSTSKYLPYTTHTDIQYTLAKLGRDLGLDVWVPKNDRNRECNIGDINSITELKNELPINFDEATIRTIEMIDVIWLKGKTIVNAFEVEHTTSIFSGLLRMADLISLQPNININLYIVAPDDRRSKVFEQIQRPTFSHLNPSLPDICKYISYESLFKGIKKIENIKSYIKPDYIDEIAELCESE